MKSKRNILIERDPAMGRVTFKTGRINHRRDRLRNRNSKLARRELRRQLFD